MKVVKVALAIACLAGVLGVGSTALASSPAGGPIKVYVTGSGTHSKILVTGAIGDYGNTTSVDKNGKVDSNGAYEKVMLRKGGFFVDATALNKKFETSQPTGNKATCSMDFVVSAPTKVYKGTGLYKGIGGNVKLTVTFAGIAPRKNGKCDFSQNAKPLAWWQSISGTGSVKFS